MNPYQPCLIYLFLDFTLNQSLDKHQKTSKWSKLNYSTWYSFIMWRLSHAYLKSMDSLMFLRFPEALGRPWAKREREHQLVLQEFGWKMASKPILPIFICWWRDGPSALKQGRVIRSVLDARILVGSRTHPGKIWGRRPIRPSLGTSIRSVILINFWLFLHFLPDFPSLINFSVFNPFFYHMDPISKPRICFHVYFHLGFRLGCYRKTTSKLVYPLLCPL
jgi:hypothetical protein